MVPSLIWFGGETRSILHVEDQLRTKDIPFNRRTLHPETFEGWNDPSQMVTNDCEVTRIR